jgi:UDP-N-acetylglucosamine 2-epimerase (non-hydrolysing)
MKRRNFLQNSLSFFGITISFLVLSLSAQGPVIIVIGTRPEGIKLIPVYNALKKAGIPTLLCSTDQHAELLHDDVFKIFGIKPDISFNIMKPNQDLYYITTCVLNKMKELLQETNPCLVLVQGDTTSALAAALAAFYYKIPVGHVEAGLRTGKKYAPFPEEMNRSIIGAIASYHFAPTDFSVQNLLKENIARSTIYCVGNTVVDALYDIRNQITQGIIHPSQTIKKCIEKAKLEHKKIMLLTAHRRESFNGGLEHIFNAVKDALEKCPELFIIYPVHPNPAIRQAIQATGLENCPNIFITKPVEYTDLIYLLDAVDFVATDSGGIQEEAVSLGKPVLVLRNETDRPEGVIHGIAQLVGTDQDCITKNIIQNIQTTKSYPKNTIYGDGTASNQIVEIIKHELITPKKESV